MFGFYFINRMCVCNQAEAAEAAQIALKVGRLSPPVNWLNEKSCTTTQGKPFTRVTLRGGYSETER